MIQLKEKILCAGCGESFPRKVAKSRFCSTRCNANFHARAKRERERKLYADKKLKEQCSIGLSIVENNTTIPHSNGKTSNGRRKSSNDKVIDPVSDNINYVALPKDGKSPGKIQKSGTSRRNSTVSTQRIDAPRDPLQGDPRGARHGFEYDESSKRVIEVKIRRPKDMTGPEIKPVHETFGKMIRNHERDILAEEISE